MRDRWRMARVAMATRGPRKHSGARRRAVTDSLRHRSDFSAGAFRSRLRGLRRLFYLSIVILGLDVRWERSGSSRYRWRYVESGRSLYHHVLAAMMTPHKKALLSEYFTVGWNVIEGIIA